MNGWATFRCCFGLVLSLLVLTFEVALVICMSDSGWEGGQWRETGVQNKLQQISHITALMHEQLESLNQREVDGHPGWVSVLLSSYVYLDLFSLPLYYV